MGLDIYIDKVRKNTDGSEDRKELCYWRKNWILMGLLPFEYSIDECGKDVILSKGDVERILQIVSHNPNNYGDFFGVEPVCSLLYYYDEYLTDGWEIMFHADW